MLCVVLAHLVRQSDSHSFPYCCKCDSDSVSDTSLRFTSSDEDKSDSGSSAESSEFEDDK